MLYLLWQFCREKKTLGEVSMKKRILAILLIAVIAVNICGCNYAPDNGNRNPLDNELNGGTSNPDETVRDVPGIGQLELFPFCNFKTASIWRDQKGEFYIYINGWGAYRQLRGLSSYHYLYFSPYSYESDNSIVVNGDVATVSIINQNGKYDEPTIITYHFNKSNDLVQLHAVPLNIKASLEYDAFFVNMHSADHGYYFLLPSPSSHYGSDWPLIMFETTDGGKSWVQIATNTFYASARCEEIFKFISPQVGIISFRDLGGCEVWERTYLTVDGGLTWTQMSELPHGDMVEWYSDVIDLEYLEDHGYYRLTVKAMNYSTFQVQLCSKDLINWSLTET